MKRLTSKIRCFDGVARAIEVESLIVNTRKIVASQFPSHCTLPYRLPVVSTWQQHHTPSSPLLFTRRPLQLHSLRRFLLLCRTAA